MQTGFWDCHMHSCFSADSQAPTEDMVRRAVSLGLEGICFTEHLDPDFPPIPGGMDYSRLDFPAYKETVCALQDKYKGKINIRYGVELGLQPHLGKELSAIAASEPFDQIIGSSHLCDGMDPYYASFYEGRTEEEAFRRYFESELENIQAFRDFDVYGHLDYIVRYSPEKNKNYRYETYADVIDAILQELIRCGIGLELNTAGFAMGLGAPHPCPEILARYRALGGEIITLGSDAHRPEDVARYFDRAKEILLQCGFRAFTVFEKRRPVFIPLE